MYNDSGLQQSDSVLYIIYICVCVYIYIHIYIPFQILFHYRLIQDIEYSFPYLQTCLSVLYVAVCIC